jgi:predicted DNA-binding transcriptional regulator AlpA
MDSKKNNHEKAWSNKFVLREEDVMDMFGFSKSTISRLRKNGEIPYSKLGGSYFYQKKELKKMLKDNLVKPN